jgi:hypothetical protein
MKTRHWIALGLSIAAAALWIVAYEVALGLIILALIVEAAAVSLYDEKESSGG